MFKVFIYPKAKLWQLLILVIIGLIVFAFAAILFLILLPIIIIIGIGLAIWFWLNYTKKTSVFSFLYVRQIFLPFVYTTCCYHLICCLNYHRLMYCLQACLPNHHLQTCLPNHHLLAYRYRLVLFLYELLLF